MSFQEIEDDLDAASIRFRRAAHLTPAPDSPWLQVLGGRAFSLTNPRAEDVDFETIATVLSRVPRFGGHTENGVLSVAQHCLEGSAAILRDTGCRDAAAAFLIHDAHEAYMGDIATPVSQALGAVAFQMNVNGGWLVRKAIRELKSRLDAAIFPAAGLPWPIPADVAAIVKEYDMRMCRTERDGRLVKPPLPWYDAVEHAEPVQGCDLYPWREGTVRACYMRACRELLPSLGAGFGPGVRPGSHL